MDSPKIPAGILGSVSCNSLGDITASSDNDAETLGTIMPYVSDLASLVGDSFGLDELQEAIFTSKDFSCAIIPGDEEIDGYIFEPKAKIGTILEGLKQANS